MSNQSFTAFFRKAMGGGNSPYDYQTQLAGGDIGTRCHSQLINIPTGLGKTAGVVLAWLWNRLLPTLNSQRSTIKSPQWPRRLVYCLPMRTLVEQTHDSVKNWIGNLRQKYPDNCDLKWLAEHSPVILMGGEENERTKVQWDIHPERPAILIGTQDMLLSRALNRGYGMSRYRWPMHFGLLNNDALWVMDETQLMGVGVETSAQFDGFRHNAKMPTFGGCTTWWMSATLDEARFATVDHPKPAGGWPTEKLSDAEQSSGQPHKLITAQKKLSSAPVTLNSTTKGSYAKQLAGLIKDRHQPDTLTLVVLNRVPRAREVFQMLTGGKSPLYPLEKVALIHSRFRPIDRERHTRLLFGEGDRIVIATQAVEAGVDVSARLLITELAPWSSLVQRMGRCNRRADIHDAQVLWVAIEPNDEKDELLLPYSKDELAEAQKGLSKLTDASPRALREVEVREKPVVRPVIRRRDLVDLFDTTADICGQDLDVSRYIRDGDDNDVQFFWRTIHGETGPLSDEKSPTRDELCRVSIGEAQKFIDKQPKPKRVWQWNALEELWRRIERVRPGGVYLIDAASGGYDQDFGWTGEPKSKITPLLSEDEKADGQGKDLQTFDRDWVRLDKHTTDVVDAITRLAADLSLAPVLKSVFHSAALWHDVGKAHKAFQDALRYGPYLPIHAEAFYAKSKNPYDRRAMVKERHGFRHELASALAWLLKGPPDAAERDLVAYLIAAHHGKVRLSIRSLPDEQGNPCDFAGFFARGIWQGDVLPAVPLGEFTTPEIALDLSFMQMGEGRHGPSWLARTVALRDRLGPLHLAFLESLLRAADARASKDSNASALDDVPTTSDSETNELAGHNRPLAKTPGAGQSAPPLGEHSRASGPEHGVRGRTGEPAEPPRDTRPERATRFVETTLGVLSYTQLAPLLGDRAVLVEADIERGLYGQSSLDEALLLEFHRRIASDLVPDWAGRYRTIEVRVGNLQLPSPHLVAQRMRDYCLDLQARGPSAAASGELTIEFLAFAEGRFLSIHPFQDFNGRVIRLFLSELLRRLDLPPVRLEAEGDAERAAYFKALEAADAGSLNPLMEIWKQRLASSEPTTA